MRVPTKRHSTPAGGCGLREAFQKGGFEPFLRFGLLVGRDQFTNGFARAAVTAIGNLVLDEVY